jgi:hypothetical protein
MGSSECILRSFAGERQCSALSEALPEVIGPDAWIELIRRARERPPAMITAHTFLGRWRGRSSEPVLLSCNDGLDYVVKGRNAGRIPVNDLVVGMLARSIAAPVPRVVLVDVPGELIADEPMLAHMQPGLAHGSEYVQDVADNYVVEHLRERGNRLRFLRLAVLWGVVSIIDRQYLYSENSPRLVYSADHSHCFPRGPSWTRLSLLRVPPAELDHELLEYCKFTDDELSKVPGILSGMDDARIADAVAAPPEAWGINMPERVALAAFLARRRDQLLGSLRGNA